MDLKRCVRSGQLYGSSRVKAVGNVHASYDAHIIPDWCDRKRGYKPSLRNVTASRLPTSSLRFCDGERVRHTLTNLTRFRQQPYTIGFMGLCQVPNIGMNVAAL